MDKQAPTCGNHTVDYKIIFMALSSTGTLRRPIAHRIGFGGTRRILARRAARGVP
ncbi:hypothetical protein Arub01_53020 [Actinomadura rubrobrunea]|uniref:Uncharacterized protein n=1 Tax=Actinomadura rubrobrunea TaxID=115335 RepID=A0A9W6Q1U3_9ACTN|nr:hypothetical protein Arub01_53020 [Actinomadura rubrobrunea]